MGKSKAAAKHGGFKQDRVSVPQGQRRGRAWPWFAVIILAGAVAYANSLSGPLFFDDQTSILNNPSIRQVWPLSVPLAPPSSTPVAGRPIVNLSFAINYALGGFDVRGYRLANIGLHILSALILFGIIRLALTGRALRERFASCSNGVALACALIWMLHPLQTEAVDYMTQRTELLMGLFYLLTLYCAIRATRSCSQGRWQAASVVSCMLGMACKESMVTAPLVVLLYDRIFVFDSMADAVRARRMLYGGLAASWLELAMLASSRSSTVGFSAGISVWTYLLNQADMVTRYLRLAIWPRSLVLDYGVPRPLTFADVLPQAVLVIVLLLGAAIALAKRPMFGFLGAWFFVTLAPTSSVIPIAPEVGAERRMYLPLAALVVLGVISGQWLLARLIQSARRRGSPLSVRFEALASAGIATIVVAALALETTNRNGDYETSVSILRTVVDRWPHGRAHFNLAVALRAQGDSTEAMEHLRLAAPAVPEAQYALGAELFDQRRFDEALVQLREFVRRTSAHPDALQARDMIARALRFQGKLPEAAAEFADALKAAPQNADLHGNLASVLLEQNDFAGAAVHYQEYLKYRPGNAAALDNLGIAFAGMGELDKAVHFLGLGLDADPTSAIAHLELAKVLLRQRDFDGAAAHADQALRLRVDDPVAHDLAGIARASQGKLDEAVDHFRRALAVNPGYADARNHLAMAQRLRGASSGAR